jgi:hypothetical protein
MLLLPQKAKTTYLQKVNPTPKKKANKAKTNQKNPTSKVKAQRSLTQKARNATTTQEPKT